MSLFSGYSILHSLQPHHETQIWKLYQQAHTQGEWSTNKTQAQVATMLHTATKLLAVAVITGEAATSSPLSSLSASTDDQPGDCVGFCLITGSLTDPLLEDVIVSPKHRHRHLATQMVHSIQHHPALAAAPGIDLYCAPSLIPLYTRLGFTVVRTADRCLMRWRRAQAATGADQPG